MNNNGHGVSRRLARGQRILENLTSHGVINPDSKNYLLAALDPYHDREFPVPTGYPDGCTQRSVVRCINMSTTVAANDSSPDWNCIISTAPFLDTIALRRTGSLPDTQRHKSTVVEWDGTSQGYDTTALPIKFINVDTYAGSQMNQWSEVDRDTAEVVTGFEMEDRFIEGMGRILGVGLEVHNVTPELYRGGTVTVGEIPQTAASDFPLNLLYRTAVEGGTGFTYQSTASQVRPINGRPASLYEAMQYPGTRQWEAKDGLYMVLPLVTTENEPQASEYITPMIYGPSSLESESGPNVSPVLICPTEPGERITSTRQIGGPMKWTPLATKFAYFTGLSPETKLTINVRVFYESFPTTADRDILPLATPSPDLDPHALALYQHCMTHLPIGVPVGENGLGEWFAQAVSEFSDVVGLGLSAIGVPFASQIASGAKMIANDYLKTQAKKKVSKGKQNSTAPILVAQNKKRKQRQKNKSGGVTMPLRKP